MSHQLEINIPFDGFYHSFYSQEIDNEETAHVENEVSEGRLEEADVAPYYDTLFSMTCYGQLHRTVAEKYVSFFNDYFSKLTGVDLGLVFVELVSPKEYNFDTDRIFAMANADALKTLRFKADERVLVETIKDRHTSRSGFISFYSNSLEDWPSEVSDWDHNQLCTLILSFIPKDEYSFEILTDMQEAGVFHEAWVNAVNWDGVQSTMQSLNEQQGEQA